MGAVLDGSAEPVKQEIKIEITSFSCLLKLLKFIKEQEKRTVFLLQCPFHDVKPFVKRLINSSFISLQGFPQAVIFKSFNVHPAQASGFIDFLGNLGQKCVDTRRATSAL